jgi:hypothetical protein
MIHSSNIALALIIAFAIFVVSRGELPIYMGILGIGGYDVTADKCNASGGGLLSSVIGAATSAATPPDGSSARTPPALPSDTQQV